MRITASPNGQLIAVIVNHGHLAGAMDIFLSDGAMERSAFPVGQMLKSINRRLEKHGIENPFAHHFAEAESESAPAPRG